jgi:hypothetical protein
MIAQSRFTELTDVLEASRGHLVTRRGGGCDSANGIYGMGGILCNFRPYIAMSGDEGLS